MVKYSNQYGIHLVAIKSFQGGHPKTREDAILQSRNEDQKIDECFTRLVDVESKIMSKLFLARIYFGESEFKKLSKLIQPHIEESNYKKAEVLDFDKTQLSLDEVDNLVKSESTKIIKKFQDDFESIRKKITK